MESNDITETNNIRELNTINDDTNICSILSVDSSISSSSTSSTESDSSDSMETDSDDSVSLSSESSQSDRDSSSDYCPSETSMEISSSEESTEDEIHSVSEESEDFSPLVDEDHFVPETKKRKRNPLDSFCLYTIRPKCPNDTNLYIGSTTCFNRRKAQHKKAVTNKRGGTYYCILYRYIRKCGGWDNFIMEKVLDYPCETKYEGLLKEKEYIIKHEATLNSVMPVSDFTERMNDI